VLFRSHDHTFRALKSDYEIKANQQVIQFNLCKPDHADEQCHGKHNSYAISKKLSKCYNLGGENQHPEFSLLDEENPSKGFKAVITGGDRTAICPSNSQRSLEVEMHCDPEKKSYEFVCHPDTCEDPRCHFKVEVHTSLACPPSDEDWGWTFITISLVVVLVYVGGGMAWNIKQRGLQGTEAIPNIELWHQVPGLVKDGCVFTKTWVMEKYATASSSRPTL